MTAKQRNLLLIAALLAALQFVVKPLLQWQRQTIDELSLNQARLERSELLLANADSLATHTAAATALEQKMLAQFPQAQEITLTQIQLQSAIETALRSQQTRIDEFSWLTAPEQSGGSLAVMRGKVTFSGDLADIVSAHFALLEQMPTIAYESMDLRNAGRRGRGGYRLTLMLNVAVQATGGQS